MAPLSRREFLRRSSRAGLSLAGGAATLVAARSVRGAPAADRIRLASIGIRGRGFPLLQGFAQRPDCQIAYLCDVNREWFPSRVKEVEKLSNRTPQTVQDFRRALDDPAVDAVVIATPDH